ncbi:Uncharacterized membrane protein YsdA, DUF1294 family [Chryseobacterium soldanellicola]|uniref:Uncharacterized membrane protein YsdA, DUF1294 family n=1 Tax=Chryseobacterium soldanellicola TaxID=311333 RepID=A0A1H1FWG5_9FLAO|nr:DUF1294 domain-containing protein [Chryseobacterium soldanellicola]SDR05282.1 Uncharacterized membrane protein YsdA, DUF1294 family [Chryseobacterium soldanellicola]
MIYCFLLTNLFAFIIFGYDKFLAKNHKRRISENILLFITFLGGTIGSVLGMLIFRHKVSKRSFLLKFGFVILIQVILICFFEVLK